MPHKTRFVLAMAMLCLGLTACGSRQVQDSLSGSSAQRLLTQAIDELATQLPERDFAEYQGQTIWLESHFPGQSSLQAYADNRLLVELARRWTIRPAARPEDADVRLTVFYISLGTDQGHLGFSLPLGILPGIDESNRINLITLEQFHGIAELYYFLGPEGTEQRGERIQSRQRNDALGLPIITIPLSTVD